MKWQAGFKIKVTCPLVCALLLKAKVDCITQGIMVPRYNIFMI